MSVRNRARASKIDALPDNRLASVDEALFSGHRAAGLNLVIQTVWVYRHAVDFAELRRLHRKLGRGLLGRRIERSPLPFARLGWVMDRGLPDIDIDIAESARPPAELSDWADDRSQLHVDAELGPGWHCGVLPLTDGSTAVSLVLSHYLVDGVGLAGVLADAIGGSTREPDYPPPRSRTRRRAVLEDARRTAGDLPEVARAVAAAGRLARRARGELASSPASRPVTLRADGGDDPVVVPAAWIEVDAHEWDARAKDLGGTGTTLVAGFAAKFAELGGRRRADDGVVTLHLPMNDRAEGDTRANAMSIAIVRVDPTRVTADLGELRAAIKQALTTLRETPDEALQVRSLIPFTPKRALKRMVDAGFTDPDVPMLCSNLGDFDPIVCRLDGTDSELVMTRATGQGVTREWLEQTGGQMTLQSWRTGGSTIYITVNAFRPGAENTKPAVRDLAARTLAEFELTGRID
ncbi:hypothetical protein [Mycobacterium sp. 94-17]|uniref:hypothetical protein n=1 Tax=Mycobacterium sp. 94-17 TaxID=2986147 RepID=UPI002D1E5F67|nr:hypothetical protein [Mycobacterium sp. 94-17]MEB4211826.1 hypothetical protein [Mycobacterium sp. 94-17]